MLLNQAPAVMLSFLKIQLLQLIVHITHGGDGSDVNSPADRPLVPFLQPGALKDISVVYNGDSNCAYYSRAECKTCMCCKWKDEVLEYADDTTTGGCGEVQFLSGKWLCQEMNVEQMKDMKCAGDLDDITRKPKKVTFRPDVVGLTKNGWSKVA